jgi:3,2-trans-enoyl-CoA isomerase
MRIVLKPSIISSLIPKGNSVCRNFATNPARLNSLVQTTVHENGYTVLSMNKKPVNSLTLEFLQDLDKALEAGESSSKGLVLTSTMPTIFCAGLEITEMYQPDQARLREFWYTVQGVFLKLYGCKVPTVACMNGHSLAGGCFLALACDYRVMVGPKYLIGLNETQLGIAAPFWIQEPMTQAIGFRKSLLALMLGTSFNAQEALNIGLIDEMVGDTPEAHKQTDVIMKKIMKISSLAYYATKMQMRNDLYNRLSNNREKDVDNFVEFIMQPTVQNQLGSYLEALKNKAKKK